MKSKLFLLGLISLSSLQAAQDDKKPVKEEESSQNPQKRKISEVNQPEEESKEDPSAKKQKLSSKKYELSDRIKEYLKHFPMPAGGYAYAPNPYSDYIRDLIKKEEKGELEDYNPNNPALLHIAVLQKDLFPFKRPKMVSKFKDGQNNMAFRKLNINKILEENQKNIDKSVGSSVNNAINIEDEALGKVKLENNNLPDVVLAPNFIPQVPENNSKNILLKPKYDLEVVLLGQVMMPQIKVTFNSTKWTKSQLFAELKKDQGWKKVYRDITVWMKKIAKQENYVYNSINILPTLETMQVFDDSDGLFK